ncbi:docking protein 1 [Pezoporus flaviventris]|uniref:docking protein 1 n=1 Tax=Pezoporus flaviventris TaxID=889875 RepID=UPI002AB31EF7|nr:docking protein 1 [Pezoporus flaviventris]
MDPPAKEGPLLVQHSHKFGTKKWKRSWLVLYPASQHGVARLEFFDCKDPVPPERLGTGRLDKTVVRLADCTSVGPVPESGPRASTAVFRLETSDRSYLFAADKQQSEEWVAKLCEIAFPGNGPSHAGVAAQRGREGSGEAPALQMAVNSIYYSRDEVNTFWVTVQRTEAAERCELRGAYVLKAERDSLVLKDPRTNEILYVWPYRLLRRYGRDKVMFSFEAGRRCSSGPGNFTFETKQGNEIFQLVEASIREQKAQVEENRQSCGSLDSDSPSVVLIRQALADSLSLEVPTEGDDAPAPKGGPAPRPSVAAEERDAASLLKARTLPELPVAQAKPAVPSTPPRSPLPKVPRALPPAEDPCIVYSEPLDSVKSFRPRLDPLYSDPIDSKPASGATDEGKRWPLCPGLYEQVWAEVHGQGPPAPARGEHIYDEPEGRAPRTLPPHACIYDKARPTGEAWRTQGHDGRAGYEYPYSPSTDDYSVPAFQGKAKGPKPVPAPKPQAAFIPKGTGKSGDLGRQRGSAASEKAVVKPSLNSSNNNNVEVLYSQVLKPQHVRKQEQSVDEGSLLPVYEDLGVI